jgi:hypothetical protein
MGTIISALTGSEDPSEVSTMAKQATEVSEVIILYPKVFLRNINQ